MRAVNIANLRKENEDEDGIIQAEVYTYDSIKSANPIQIGFLLFKNLKPSKYEPLAGREAIRHSTIPGR